MSELIDCTILEWIVMQTTDFGWLKHVTVGSLVATNVPLWWRMLITGEATHEWWQGVDGKTYLLDFAANLQLVLKKLFKFTKSINKLRNKSSV